MNKLFKVSLLFLVPCLFIFSSCKEEEVMLPPAPTLTAVSPTEGLPGTLLTLTGTNLQDVRIVRFGSIEAITDEDAEIFDFSPENNTPTTVTVRVPENAPTGEIVIRVTHDGGTAGIPFTVLEPEEEEEEEVVEEEEEEVEEEEEEEEE